MDLTTLTSLKALLEIDTAGDTRDDAELAVLIQSVSARIERYLRRKLQSGVERTQVFDVLGATKRLLLEAFPVVSITSATKAEDQDWAEGTELTEGAGYILDSEFGRLLPVQAVSVAAQAWPRGYRSLRVIYNGGLADDTDALVANYPDLARACEMQAAEEWRRRKSPSATSRQTQGTNVQRDGAVTWLPLVADMLADFRRVSF